MDTFSLINLIKAKTCYKSATGTILDIMLANKIRSLQKTSTVTTCISDCRKMIVTCLKAHFKKLPPKKVVYRDHKNFSKNTFLYDLDQRLIQGKLYSQKIPLMYLMKLLKASFIITHPLKRNLFAVMMALI